MTLEELDKFKFCIDRADSYVFEYAGKYCQFSTGILHNPEMQIQIIRRARLISIMTDPLGIDLTRCNFSILVEDFVPTFEQEGNFCKISLDVPENHYVFRFYDLKED